MYSAIHNYVARRFQVNAQLLKCSNQIYLLKGFTGITSPGIRKGTALLDTQDGGRNEGQEERPPMISNLIQRAWKMTMISLKK
jgi:hypothetical protein